MNREILEEVLSRKPPEILYHYTTQAGLMGIIREKEIWATHTQHLNDRSEYLHALGMTSHALDRKIRREKDTTRKALLVDMRQVIEGNESMNVAVCSFSEDRDSLSQWRAYGSSASGFAIGIAGKSLADAVNREQFHLVQCLYKEREQARLMESLINLVLEENLQSRREEDDLIKGGNLRAYLHRFAPIIKNACFSEEKEWRIISHPLSCRNKRYTYRQGSSMIIPYYRFPLADEGGNLHINEIIVGPTIHVQQSMGSVDSFLVSQGLRNVPVTASGVPYRNW
jgi:Protein of unknown function (DUF2971)